LTPVPDSGSHLPAQALAALERLGAMSLRNQSMQSVLQTVSDLAKSVLPGDPETSISLLANDRALTPVFTGELALQLDETQYDQGYGPCLHAARTGELTEIRDTRTDTRWPAYSQVAAERGNLSSLSVPLPIAENVSGALNVYAREPEAFDEEARWVATRFAPYAGAAVGNAHAYQTAREMADNLQIALESRAVIDQAKGILMERHKLTADQAFQALAAVSMRTNTKVRDVAELLVRTGTIDLQNSGLV
jgi:GAF domain-containing protein